MEGASTSLGKGGGTLAASADAYVPAEDLAVITAYFNPHHFRRKRQGFDLFAESMRSSGIPLFIGECAVGDERFELTGVDNVSQFRASDALWQKERLLNLMIDRVPDRFTKIAWIDADVLFENPLWAVQASQMLDELAVIQLFSVGIRLGPDELVFTGPGECHHSYAFVYSALPGFSRFGGYSLHGGTGFAWAADREVLAASGLYDVAPVGADHLIAHAFTGDFSSRCLPIILGSAGYAEHYREWAEPMWERVRGRVGYVPGALLHLWHGERERRRYSQRAADLYELGYDPAVHLQLDSSGLWAWSEAATASYREWSAEYFRGRREDTMEFVP